MKLSIIFLVLLTALTTGCCSWKIDVVIPQTGEHLTASGFRIGGQQIQGELDTPSGYKVKMNQKSQELNPQEIGEAVGKLIKAGAGLP